MPIPEFVVDLRRRIGHDPLWLMASSGIVLREVDGVEQVLLVRRSDSGQWTVPAGMESTEADWFGLDEGLAQAGES